MARLKRSSNCRVINRSIATVQAVDWEQSLKPMLVHGNYPYSRPGALVFGRGRLGLGCDEADDLEKIL